MLTINAHPGRTELRVFALVWVVFFGVLGKMALWTPGTLLAASAVTGAMLAASLVFNTEVSRRAQSLGLSIPLMLMVVATAERLGAGAWHVASVLWLAGVIGCVVALVSLKAAGAMYAAWMRAALPLGWTFSQVALGAVFFLVATPIGLVMRALGHDPLDIRPRDPMSSNWRDRGGAAPAERYFRQF